MPALLQHLGVDSQGASSAETGNSGSVGWGIRRSDGTRLTTDQSLAAQDVRDGEVLYLVSLDEDWPEPDYDDLVLAVADGTERLGSQWYGPFTRRTGLLAGGAVLLLGLPLLFLAGPPWRVPAIGALGIAVVILIGGTVLSRALGDAGAGGAIGALSMPYAVAGGLIVLLGDEPLGRLAAAHVLVAAVALLLAAVTGFVAIADRLWLFVAGTLIALCGAVGALLCLAGLDPAGSAAVVIAAAAAVAPMSTVLSVRMSRLPMPDLPQTTQDLLRDHPMPPRERVFAAVARAEDFYAGTLLGVGVVSLACIGVLSVDGGLAAPMLAATVALLALLRARSLDRPRQRVPLLATGVLGVVTVIVGVSARQDRAVLPAVVLLGLLPAALIAVGAGLRYARRRPGPQLGRLADWSEFLLGAAVVPLVVAATGLFAYVRGLGG